MSMADRKIIGGKFRLLAGLFYGKKYL